MDLLNVHIAHWTIQLSGLVEGKKKEGGEQGPFHCTGTQKLSTKWRTGLANRRFIKANQ